MPDYADAAASRYEAAWVKVQTAASDIFMAIKDMPPDDILLALQELDMRTIVGDMMESAIVDLEAAYASGLELIAPGGNLSDEVLQALIDIDTRVYVGKTGATADELQRLIARSTLTNASETLFSEELLRTGLQPHQANALANDSMRKYQRSVRSIQAQQEPDDKLYIYEGPVDDRTRDDCMAMLEAGPLTYAEVEANFPGAFGSGGGFNCRHEWQPYRKARQYKESAIQAEYKVREAVA